MRYEVEAKVTDVDRQVVAGRTHFMVHPAAHYLGLKGPDGFGEAGQAMSVSVRARDVLSKARIAVKDVQVELVQRVWKTVKKKNAWGGFENVSEAQEITVDTCTADASIDGEGLLGYPGVGRELQPCEGPRSGRPRRSPVSGSGCSGPAKPRGTTMIPTW